MATDKKSNSYDVGRGLFGMFITYLLKPRKKNKLVEKKVKVSRYGGGATQGAREKARRRAQLARGMHKECRMVSR